MRRCLAGHRAGATVRLIEKKEYAMIAVVSNCFEKKERRGKWVLPFGVEL
jgi:hypothetical protein